MIEHKDALGQVLAVDMPVAVSYNNSIQICVIHKMTPKMIRVMPIRAKYRGSGFLKYGADMVAVDPHLATLHALKQ
jgi:hypothetical protein